MKKNSALTPHSSQNQHMRTVLHQQRLTDTGLFTNAFRSDHFTHKEVVVRIRIS
jgi:hypothetical protein